MTEITHEALNEIADALRRGCDGSIPIEAAEKLECIADALRTGQLIHAVPSVELTERQSETLHKALLASYDSMVPPMPSGDEVEAVARAICGASGDVWRTGEGMRSPFAAQADRVNNHWRFKATAAITALDAHRGKQ